MISIEVREAPFEPWAYLAQWQATQGGASTRSGATAVFVGTMRDFNEGDEVESLYLEHYPRMTERHLQQLAQEAVAQWQLHDLLIVHRVGQLYPAQAIVLVAAWSAHRAAAFDACRQVMETLKHTTPFWKKEVLLDGSVRWVERNTAG